MIAEALLPIFFVIFLGYLAGAQRIIDNQHLASLIVLLLTFAVSGQNAREAILLTAIPAGFVAILLGLNYGVRSQAIGSTLTLSSLVSVITLTAAIFLTSQMK